MRAYVNAADAGQHAIDQSEKSPRTRALGTAYLVPLRRGTGRRRRNHVVHVRSLRTEAPGLAPAYHYKCADAVIREVDG